jgi:hypothetical protein
MPLPPRSSRLSALSRRLVLVAMGALLLAVGAGCGLSSGAALTPLEIDTHGVSVLKAPSDKVFKATLDALKVLNYEIALERPDKGLIVTKRKSVRDVAVGSYSAAVELSYTRQYTIEIKETGGGTARVRATPAIFENAADISARPVWDLDSPLGERELWKQLFAKIEQLL